MTTINRKAVDGREISVGDVIGVDHFGNQAEYESYYFVVQVEAPDKFKLVFDYDISPSSLYWHDYEEPENVLKESRQLYILSKERALEYLDYYKNAIS